MEYRRLGRSGLLVSELALGTMVFGEDGPRAASPEDGTSMIHRFLDAGGNHIDTADVYAGGRSEEIVGKAIKLRRDDVVLATKVRFPMGAGPNDQGSSRHHILSGVDASLRRLGTDHIELLYLHCWDPITPLDESLRALDDVVTSGKVRYLGVSNYMPWQLATALNMADAMGFHRFVAAQYQYNLITRDIEEDFFDLLEAEGLGLAPWSPLAGGFLAGKYTRGERPSEDEGRLGSQPDTDEEAWVKRQDDRSWAIDAAVRQVASDVGASPAEVALAWVLAQRAVASVIIGARTMGQLESNLAATDVSLGAEHLARLDEASAVPSRYPARFIANYGKR
ncbi:MAG: aldo/keto reductase [Acidimicrobiia bacterium]|jgi:aryl-alcohol dehydrogenase-like predicted oxidoreductase|nr:MAG: aldo/keto reductase [Acidimicrobiia bacterium]